MLVIRALFLHYPYTYVPTQSRPPRCAECLCWYSHFGEAFLCFYKLFYFFDFVFQPLKFSLSINLFGDVRDLVTDHAQCEWVSIRHLSRPPLQFRSAGRHRFPCSQNGYPYVLFAPQSIIRPLLHGTSSRVIKVSENKMSQTDQLHPSGSVAG